MTIVRNVWRPRRAKRPIGCSDTPFVLSGTALATALNTTLKTHSEILDGTWSWYVGPGTTCALVSCLTRNVNSEKTVQSVMIDLFAGNSADVLQKSTQVITLHNNI